MELGPTPMRRGPWAAGADAKRTPSRFPEDVGHRSLGRSCLVGVVSPGVQRTVWERGKDRKLRTITRNKYCCWGRTVAGQHWQEKDRRELVPSPSWALRAPQGIPSGRATWQRNNVVCRVPTLTTQGGVWKGESRDHY